MPESTSPAPSDASPVTMPNLPLGPLLKALGDPLRWAIMGELSAGEPLMVIEIAGTLNRPATLISKHLATLRRAGAVVSGRAGLYTIPARFRPLPGERVADFGYCLLRFTAPEPS